MKRFKMTRRNFLKGSTFITGSAAGTSLFVGMNPELEAAPAAAGNTATRTTALTQCPYSCFFFFSIGCGVHYSIVSAFTLVVRS